MSFGFSCSVIIHHCAHQAFLSHSRNRKPHEAWRPAQLPSSAVVMIHENSFTLRADFKIFVAAHLLRFPPSATSNYYLPCLSPTNLGKRSCACISAKIAQKVFWKLFCLNKLTRSCNSVSVTRTFISCVSNSYHRFLEFSFKFNEKSSHGYTRHICIQRGYFICCI